MSGYTKLQQVYGAVKNNLEGRTPSNAYMASILGSVLTDYCDTSALSANELEPVADLRDSYTINEPNDSILAKYDDDTAVHLNAVAQALAYDKDNPSTFLIMSWYWTVFKNTNDAIWALNMISESLKSEPDDSRTLDFLSLWSALALQVGIEP
jgi:hypothetical protein